MHSVVLEAGVRARSFTEEGLALLRAYGSVDLITLEADSRQQAMSEFAERLRKAGAALISPWFIPATQP